MNLKIWNICPIAWNEDCLVDGRLLSFNNLWACRWIPKFGRDILPPSALKIEAISSSETLVSTYESTRRFTQKTNNDIRNPDLKTDFIREDLNTQAYWLWRPTFIKRN